MPDYIKVHSSNGKWKMGCLTGHKEAPFYEIVDIYGKKFLWVDKDIEKVEGAQKERFHNLFQKRKQLKKSCPVLKTHKDSRTPSGRYAVDNADTVANTFRGASLSTIYEMTHQILLDNHYEGISLQDLQDRYRHLNHGLQRMSLGNLARGALKDT